MRRRHTLDQHTQGRIRVLQNANLDEREALQRTVDQALSRYNKAVLLAGEMASKQAQVIEQLAYTEEGFFRTLNGHADLLPPPEMSGYTRTGAARGQGASPSQLAGATEPRAQAAVASISPNGSTDPLDLSEATDDSYREPQATQRTRKGLTATESKRIRDAATEAAMRAASPSDIDGGPLRGILGDTTDPAVALGFHVGRFPMFGGYGPGNGDQLGFYAGTAFTQGNEITGLSARERKGITTLVQRIVGPEAIALAGAANYILPNKIIEMVGDVNSDPNVSWVLPLEAYGAVRRGEGYAAGIYLGIYVKKAGTLETHVVFGYWGIVAMSATELDIASMKQFELTPNTLSAIGYSCLRNLIDHQNPMIELRELSIRTGIADPTQPDKLVKTPNGSFIVAKGIDRRKEFPSFIESGDLPEDLASVPQPLRSNMRGRIVFTDWRNKMIHYYTESGKLHVKLFGTATEISDYDYEQLYATSVAIHRSELTETVHTLTSLRRRHLPVPEEAKAAYISHPWNPNLKGFRDAMSTTTSGQADPALQVSLTNLRESYKGDQVLFNLVQSYFDVVSFDMAHALVNGYSFTGGSDDVTSFEDVQDNRTAVQRMRVPQIGTLLHLAKQSSLPSKQDVLTRIASAKARMEDPDMSFLIRGIGKYLNARGHQEIYKLKPHQVRVLAMLLPLDKGILDVDMGGGKSIIAILKIIAMIERLREQGIKPRPLVVVPNSLIPTFYREIKKFTKQDPNDPHSTSINVVTLQNNTVTKRMSRDAMISTLQRAPENTIILASYSWLAGDRTPIHTGEYITGTAGKREPRVEYRFNRVENLLDLIGVNIVFLDECHKIKANNRVNGDFVHKAAMALARAPYRFEMTGTFISRTPFDIYNQVKFIDPTILGSLQQFKEEFTSNEGRTWDSEKLKRLRTHLIQRGVITVRREEWLYLMPEKREHFHFVDFARETPIVYKLYKSLWKATLDEFPQELNQLLEGGTLLGGTDSDTDIDSDADILAVANAENEEQEEAAISALQQAQQEAARQIKAVRNSKVAGRMMALRALITAPEKFPLFTSIAEHMQEIVNFDIDDLKRGPKDRIVKEILNKHFSPTGGRYVKQSAQQTPDHLKTGKVIIFSDRAIIARHFEQMLREVYGDGVCYYDSSHKQHLDDFSDPEKETPFILCAVENSIREGVNLQAASRIIRLTVPWTTGDYDQTCARAFRTGQKKAVDIDNIICEYSFEPAMLARLITRENTNKKVSSNYNNEHNIPEITVNLRTADPDSDSALRTKGDLENYRATTTASAVNLIHIHDSIYTYEKHESKLWRVAYLTKITDDEALAEAHPDRYITTNTDRSGKLYVRLGTPLRIAQSEPLPARLPAIVNLHMLGIPVRLTQRGGKYRALLYTPDSRSPGSLILSSTSLYQLDEENERMTTGQVGGTSATYEPWPTLGVRADEMAQTETLVADDESNGNETLLHPEERMDKRIADALDEAIALNIDPRLSRGIQQSEHSEKIKDNLIKVVKNAAINGIAHPLFYRSKAMGYLFKAATGVDLDQKRATPVIDSQIKQTSKYVRHNLNIQHAEYRISNPEAENVLPAQAPRARKKNTVLVPESNDAADRESLRLSIGVGHGTSGNFASHEQAIIAVDFGPTNPQASEFFALAKGGKFGQWVPMNRTIFRQIKSAQDFKNLEDVMYDRGISLVFDDAARSRTMLQKLLNTLPVETNEEDESVGLLSSHAIASTTEPTEDEAQEDDDLFLIHEWAYMAIDRKVVLYIMDSPANAPLLRPLISLGFKRTTKMMMHFTSSADLPKTISKIEAAGFKLRHREALNTRAMRLLKTRI